MNIPFTPVADVADRVNAVLASASADPLYDADRTTRALEGTNGTRFYLAYGTPDRRRNADPLLFDPRSTECFCQFSGTHPTLRMNTASSVLLLERRAKAHQFATVCGPEPETRHFEDMLDLAARLRPGSLTTLNLHGSGASGPQHFHTQIVSLSKNTGATESPNSLGVLLKNVRVRTEPIMSHAGIDVREITFPLWGCKIQFSPIYSPREVGKVLHRTVHRGVRYASQMALGYNLYIRWDAEPGAVTILFRERQKECPFQLDEVLHLVDQIDSATGEAIRTSPNQRWRWGYCECLGGFPARDAAFADTSAGKFDHSFWEAVLGFASVTSRYRPSILNQFTSQLHEIVGADFS